MCLCVTTCDFIYCGYSCWSIVVWGLFVSCLKVWCRPVTDIVCNLSVSCRGISWTESSHVIHGRVHFNVVFTAEARRCCWKSDWLKNWPDWALKTRFQFKSVAYLPSIDVIETISLHLYPSLCLPNFDAKFRLRAFKATLLWECHHAFWAALL